MRRLILAAVALCWIGGQPARGQELLTDYAARGGFGTPESQFAPPTFGPLTFYGDRPTFDLAAPGLPIEDWEDFNVAPGQIGACNAPANSGTSCAAYGPGDILPGLEIADDPGPDPSGLTVIGAGFNNNPSIQFGTNLFADALRVNFAPAVDAAGMDIACHFAAGAVDVEIFDVAGALLGMVPSACSNAGTFFGVISALPIASIRILHPTPRAELIDNVAFGDVQIPVELTAFEVD